ncbi:MAG: hypothetical protein EOP49_04370 [Sphingobacteriales bacterium]|nr:MAG: hypothetical protein EOP49_04370 [Sphingobacteriales bacterium]
MKKSFGTPTELVRKFGYSFSTNNLLTDFHTHPYGELGATLTAMEQSGDIENLQRTKPNYPNTKYIVLFRVVGETKPAEYDYTHEYKSWLQ